MTITKHDGINGKCFKIVDGKIEYILHDLFVSKLRRRFNTTKNKEAIKLYHKEKF